MITRRAAPEDREDVALKVSPKVGAERLAPALVGIPKEGVTLKTAWRAAWAYSDEHAPSLSFSARGLRPRAFMAIADAVDGGDCGPSTLDGLDALDRWRRPRLRQPKGL